MTFLTKECLTQPATIEEREIEGFGIAKIIRLTRSKRMKLDSWLRPGGDLNEWRKDNFDLKLVSLCLLDGDGELMFELETDEQFSEFVDQVADADSVPWELVIRQVLIANGYMQEVDEKAPEAVLEKLEGFKQTLIDCLPADSQERLEFLTLMNWQTA